MQGVLLSVFGLGSSLSIDSSTAALVGTVLFTIVFEVSTHHLEHRVEGTPYMAMLSKIYKELMIMGCISFAVFMLVQLGGVGHTQAFFAFEFAHIIVFFTAMFYVLQATFLMLISYRLKGLYSVATKAPVHRLVALASQARQSWEFNAHWLPLSKLRDTVEFKLVCHYFLEAFDLPIEFDFSLYMRDCIDAHILALLDIQASSWLVIVGVFLLNWSRVKLWLLFSSGSKDVQLGTYSEDASYAADDHHRLTGGAVVDGDGAEGYRAAADSERGDGLPMFILGGFLLLVLGVAYLFTARSVELKLLRKCGCHEPKAYSEQLHKLEEDVLESKHSGKETHRAKDMNHLKARLTSLTARRDQEMRNVVAEAELAAPYAQQEKISMPFGGKTKPKAGPASALEKMERGKLAANAPSKGEWRVVPVEGTELQQELCSMTADSGTDGDKAMRLVPLQAAKQVPSQATSARKQSVADSNPIVAKARHRTSVSQMQRGTKDELSPKDRIRRVSMLQAAHAQRRQSSVVRRSSLVSQANAASQPSQEGDADPILRAPQQPGITDLQKKKTLRQGTSAHARRKTTMKLSHDIRDIFPLESIAFFHKVLEVLMLLNCVYLALWATNFVVVAKAYRFTALYSILELLPAIVLIPVFGLSLKTSSLVTAISAVDPSIIGKVVDEQIDLQNTVSEFRTRLITRFEALEVNASDGLLTLFEANDNGDGELTTE
ncbi:unnamed protein product, partial [Chrysoparadoxa australica]